MKKRKSVKRKIIRTTIHHYKGIQFRITTMPMRELGRNGWTWAAKLGGLLGSGSRLGESHGHTRGDAAAKIQKKMEARIDARQSG